MAGLRSVLLFRSLNGRLTGCWPVPSFIDGVGDYDFCCCHYNIGGDAAIVLVGRWGGWLVLEVVFDKG